MVYKGTRGHGKLRLSRWNYDKIDENWKKMKIDKTWNGWKEEIRKKDIFKRSIFFVKSRLAGNFHLALQENVTTLNSNSKQTTGRINLKPTRVTPAVVKVFDVVPKTFCFWVSDAPSRKNWRGWIILFHRLGKLAGWLGKPWTSDAVAVLFPSFLLLWWKIIPGKHKDIL